MDYWKTYWISEYDAWTCFGIDCLKLTNCKVHLNETSKYLFEGQHEKIINDLSPKQTILLDCQYNFGKYNVARLFRKQPHDAIKMINIREDSFILALMSGNPETIHYVMEKFPDYKLSATVHRTFLNYYDLKAEQYHDCAHLLLLSFANNGINMDEEYFNREFLNYREEDRKKLKRFLACKLELGI